MSFTHAKVAVVLTCYNEGRFIGAAVRSVLEQTRDELIDTIVIADDGSEESTLAKLREIERWDPRITVLYGPGGAGLPAQRNAAIAHTSSPHIAILDGDDLWTANKLEMQVPKLDDEPGVGLVYSGYFTFAGDHINSASRAKVLDITSGADLTATYFLNDPPIIPSTTLIRRTHFLACGGFDPQVRIFEDTDFYLRLSRYCRFAMVNMPLLYKRSNHQGITGSRKDLLAHHAFVAFKAAAEDPRLLPMVPRRLAERARKLGNQRFLLGDVEDAQRLLRAAVRLNFWNIRAWMSLIGSTWIGWPVRRILASKLFARRTALGATQTLV
jgi:glycosyltransferase involved in cell wall biosynthesis